MGRTEGSPPGGATAGWVLALLILTVLCGLGSRRFGAHLPSILAEHADDAMWTVAAYLAMCRLLPRWRPACVLLAAVALSVLVEFSQLLDWPPLDRARRTRVGRLFLGSGFLWSDLVRYTAGGLLAFAADRWLSRRSSPPPSGSPQQPGPRAG